MASTREAMAAGHASNLLLLLLAAVAAVLTTSSSIMAPRHAAAAAAAQAPVALEQTDAQAQPAHVAGGAVDVDSLVPPPSAYDLQVNNKTPGKLDAEDAIGKQLLRTLVSLLAVLVLIYLFAKVALPRLVRGKLFSGGGQGKSLRVIERLQLDARHALHWIELEGGVRLLIGTGGERGVRLLLRRVPGGGTQDDAERDGAGRHGDDGSDDESDDASAKAGPGAFSEFLGDVAGRGLLTAAQRSGGELDA